VRCYRVTRVTRVAAEWSAGFGANLGLLRTEDRSRSVVGLGLKPWLGELGAEGVG